MIRVGIAADHGGFELKKKLTDALSSEYEMVDFGAHTLTLEDDYPDIVVPLAKAVGWERLWRPIRFLEFERH
jgi:ribose 5-phosphate isomerase B